MSTSVKAALSVNCWWETPAKVLEAENCLYNRVNIVRKNFTLTEPEFHYILFYYSPAYDALIFHMNGMNKI